MTFGSRFAVVSLALFAGLESQTARSADLAGSISIGTQANNFDLTTMNGEVDSVIDWVVWGGGTSTSLSPTNAKNGGTAISDLTL